MAYLAMAMVLLLTYLIRHADNKMQEKQDKRIEGLHKQAYGWIDANTSSVALARERKAEIDTMIHNCVEHNGRKYSTSELKQVSTKKEREARNDAELNGEHYVSSDMAYAVIASEVYTPTAEDIWEYTEHTEDEKREHYIGCLMQKLGLSREDAERRADKFYGDIKERGNGKDTHQ